MHGLSRLSNGVSSLSPPSSPRRRGKSAGAAATGGCGGGAGSFRGGGGGRAEVKNVVEKFGYLLISAMYRRRGVLFFAPLLYVSGMLMYMGIMGFNAVNNISGSGGDAVGPGSVYRSPEVFESLWPLMEAESNRSSNMLMNVWNPKLGQVWKPCIKQTVSHSGFSEFPKSNGFLIIEANGGLNQQRLSICDAVAVAGLLNATLVIPIFHLNSVWQDSRAVRIAPFSNRLAHAVPPYVQGLRCLCNFEALRFSEPIRMLAAKMVDRMDMVAFSCCIYDGGEEEKRDMDIVRERSWRGKFRRRGRVIRPGANRIDGKCPLTPLEVGVMLRGMGFDNNTSLFVAAGKIYKVERHMAPLKQMFPGLETKETLASPEELTSFMDMLHHNDVKGRELRKPSSSLYMYPMPDCMCRKSDSRIESSNTTKTT
ncbi:hypothetical protein DH2020_049574 [Rehmannia glutinosa]|uniref:O-fucosyltransferase family protein n=1 Tax=Rehmannia glutinosa TaxID=99300 RepID=A0ABR0U2G6_REHGL